MTLTHIYLILISRKRNLKLHEQLWENSKNKFMQFFYFKYTHVCDARVGTSQIVFFWIYDSLFRLRANDDNIHWSQFKWSQGRRRRKSVRGNFCTLKNQEERNILKKSLKEFVHFLNCVYMHSHMFEWDPLVCTIKRIL